MHQHIYYNVGSVDYKHTANYMGFAYNRPKAIQIVATTSLQLQFQSGSHPEE